MTDSNPLDLDNLRAYARAALERAEKATPGPWQSDTADDGQAIERLGVVSGQGWICDIDISRRITRKSHDGNLPNAMFVAASRLDVPNLAASVLTLCAEVERLRAENAVHVQDMALLSAALDPLQTMAEHD